MTLVRVTAPGVAVVSLAEAKAHLNLEADMTDADEAIQGFIDAAIGEVDGADGLLSRALITQVWRAEMDCFPRVIEIPLPPCQSIDEIAYIADPDDSPEYSVLDPAGYRVTGVGGAGKAEITPVYGGSWPDTLGVKAAVLVTFTAGYGDMPEDVPAPIRAAVLEIVASRFAFRESVTPGVQAFALPRSALDALERFRIRTF